MGGWTIILIIIIIIAMENYIIYLMKLYSSLNNTIKLFIFLFTVQIH